MTGPPPAVRLSARARTTLAWGATVTWALGAAVAARIGYWTGLGGTALLLGVVALLVNGFPSQRAVRSVVQVGAAVGCALVMALAAWTLYPALARLMPRIVVDKIGLYGAFAALPPFAAAMLLPPIIVGEELVWRGVVQDVLWPRAGRGANVFWCAAIYGLATLPSGSPLLASTAFACGLVWSGLRAMTGGVLAPIICHLTWAVLVLFVRPVRLG